MKKIISLSIFIALSVGLNSCAKGDDSIPLENRATAILGQWDYEAITSNRAVDLNGDNISNLDLLGTQEIMQCVKDNVTTFTENGPSGKPEYNITESNLACDGNSSFSFVEEDFWSFGSNNTVINFENREPFRIISLTKSRLTLETDDVFQGSDYVITIVYRKR